MAKACHATQATDPQATFVIQTSFADHNQYNLTLPNTTEAENQLMLGDYSPCRQTSYKPAGSNTHCNATHQKSTHGVWWHVPIEIMSTSAYTTPTYFSPYCQCATIRSFVLLNHLPLVCSHMLAETKAPILWAYLCCPAPATKSILISALHHTRHPHPCTLNHPIISLLIRNTSPTRARMVRTCKNDFRATFRLILPDSQYSHMIHLIRTVPNHACESW